MKKSDLKVLIIGSGGREHALAWMCAKSPCVSRIFCAPGNGGTEAVAKNIPISIDESTSLLKWAQKEKIDLTLVGPEGPLAQGIVDQFQADGLSIFGVNQRAATLESSKVFAKQFMKKYGIPTADFGLFQEFSKAREFIKSHPYPLVIKANGLAQGKGVVICASEGEAAITLQGMLKDHRWGKAGEEVVIESFLEGEELSYIGLLDGQTFLPFAASQDHKKIFDGEKGPNTGGMGAISPVPWFDKSWERQIEDSIVTPLIQGLKLEGICYQGVLYMGLMIRQGKVNVLEFNTRFGDPETQVILMRLKSDLVPLLLATVEASLHTLVPADVMWDERPSACIVMTAAGYPGVYSKGDLISGWDRKLSDTALFHAGTMLKRGKLLTAGGRVLNVVSIGKDYRSAVERAYEQVASIGWKGAYYRKDIGWRLWQHLK